MKETHGKKITHEMKGTNLKKRWNGLLAFALVLTMMFGSSLTVLAAGSTPATTALTTDGTPKGVIIDTAGAPTRPNTTNNNSNTKHGTEEQENQGETQQDEAGSGSEHEHSFKWIVTLEPTEKTDGVSSHICLGCGYVDETQPVSNAMAVVKKIIDAIRDAGEGETVVIEQNVLFCYTAKIMDELSKRPDVSIQTVYTDENGVTRSFTIPAGAAPTDGELFYGFTYLGNLYGWD